MWQWGQAAEIMETSRDASRSQPVCTEDGGSGPALPSWLTSRKQPLATVHGGRPNCLRYTARKCASPGVWKAIETATVWFEVDRDGSLYAARRDGAPQPCGVAARPAASARLTATCGW